MTVNSVTPAASTNVIANLGGAYSENFPMAGGNQSGGRLDLPDSTNRFRMADAGQYMTVVGWLKWNGPDAHTDLRQGIVSTLPGSMNSGWSFSVLSDGKLQIAINSGGRNSTSTNLVVSTNAWTHFALTYSYGGDPSFYINGDNAGLNMSYYGAKAVTNYNPIEIGNVDGTYLPINGKLDDVALFDTILSAGKVRALVTAPGVVSGFNVGVMNQLFSLYDAAGGSTTITNGIKRQTWSYATNLTSHVAGDSWTNTTGGIFIQFGSNTGVKHLPRGTMMCVD